MDNYTTAFSEMRDGQEAGGDWSGREGAGRKNACFEEVRDGQGKP